MLINHWCILPRGITTKLARSLVNFWVHENIDIIIIIIIIIITINNIASASDCRSYIVANDERPGELVVHAGVLHRHKSRIDDNAQRYEQVDKGIHDEQLDNVRELVPARTALPAEQQMHTFGLDVLLQHPLLAEYT